MNRFEYELEEPFEWDPASVVGAIFVGLLCVKYPYVFWILLAIALSAKYVGIILGGAIGLLYGLLRVIFGKV